MQLSVDGVTWLTVASVSPSDQWILQTLDLGAYAGQLVYIQFLWSGAPASDAAITGLWSVDEVQVEAALPLPTATVTDKPVATLEPVVTETPQSTATALPSPMVATAEPAPTEETMP